ncbi:hypothetical protein K439DRAFT_1188989 [Ramaria rubella]|nr:hypothetical protein K439DRAFT_1188989 [Ramaria rubella]
MRSTESARITKLNKRAMAAEAENADLKALNEDLLRQIPSGSSKKSAQGVEELEDHILCEICQDRLWQPYTLVECGHTQCQSCLTDWFNTALTANPNHPRYECPKCRTRVRHKPIDNFMLKEVVRAISRAIDPANGSPPAPSRQQNGQGSWTKFFK